MRELIVRYTGFHIPAMVTVAALMLAPAAEVEAFQTTYRPIVPPPPPRVAPPTVTTPRTAPSRVPPASPNVAPPPRNPPSVTTPGAATPRLTPGTPGGGSTPGASGRPIISGIGRSAPARPDDRVTRTTAGAEIHRGPDGKLREVRARGVQIYHGPGGSRTAMAERRLGVVVAGNQYGHGYVQEQFWYNGAEFVQRTYSVDRLTKPGLYQRCYYYDKLSLEVYAPRVFYGSAFYGWVYNPWAASVPYSWRWASEPWYSYFAQYFTPSPAYGSPSDWLTDYFLAQTLDDAYKEDTAERDGRTLPASTPLAPETGQPTAGAPRTPSEPAPAPLTAEVKQDIAEEVRRQIALENAEAAGGVEEPPDPDSSGVARMLAEDTTRVFVVSAPLSLMSGTGECAVAEGDVLQLKPGTPPAATSAKLTVLASKGADCAGGVMVTVGVADLQNMQNYMRETIDQGLGYLLLTQGEKGTPAAPAWVVQPPTEAGWGKTAPVPATNVTAELRQLTKEADLAEREALKTPAAAPVTNASLIGKSPDEVKSMLGKPKSVVDLGAKKIYVFEDRRVTFTHDKATDIQ